MILRTVDVKHTWRRLTKDLALPAGPDQGWLSTTGFLDAVDRNLKRTLDA